MTVEISRNDREFMAGYMDGRNLDAPEPSANRSHCYRHSFAIGRAEVERRQPPSWVDSMFNAVVAEWKDNRHDG